MSNYPAPNGANQPEQFEEPLEEEDSKKSPGMVRWIMIGLGVFVAILVVALILGVILAATSGGEGGTASLLATVRDVFIIILALQGILISVALVVLIAQITALINLLSSEIRPIIDETRETIHTARGTAEFVSQNVARPVIRATSAAVGVRTFVVSLLGIRRNINGHARRR